MNRCDAHPLLYDTFNLSASLAVAAALSTWSSPQLTGASDTTTLPERTPDIVSPGVTATGASSGLGAPGARSCPRLVEMNRPGISTHAATFARCGSECVDDRRVARAPYPSGPDDPEVTGEHRDCRHPSRSSRSVYRSTRCAAGRCSVGRCSVGSVSRRQGVSRLRLPLQIARTPMILIECGQLRSAA